MAIRAFYESLHPIYDELDLIKRITRDLNDIRGNVAIWFSFPGLNLCQFRVSTHLVKDGNEEFEAYTRALNEKIKSPNIEFHGICYDHSDIDKLFDKYGDINKTNTKIVNLAEAIAVCKSTAKMFVDDIKSAQTHSYKSSYYKMLPENPVESFVIIGDIVYTIQAWGLPVFKNGNFEDPFKGNTDVKLVKLIAYRQHDGELAKTIIERTKTIINS